MLNEFSDTSESPMKDVNDTSTRRRLGRPPKPRYQVRSERVVSFVTRAEFDALMDLADAGNESVSAVVHRIVRSALTKQNGKDSG